LLIVAVRAHHSCATVVDVVVIAILSLNHDGLAVIVSVAVPAAVTVNVVILLYHSSHVTVSVSDTVMMSDAPENSNHSQSDTVKYIFTVPHTSPVVSLSSSFITSVGVSHH
jgi:hypothetical protein